MFKKIFYSKTGVFLLIFFVIEFFRFLFLPQALRNLNNFRLLMVIIIIMAMWGFDNDKIRIRNSYLKKFDLLMICLAICVFLNCISCLYYRKQSVFETFCNWSPVLLLYLYYPLSSINLKVKDWEKILFWLFVINLLAHVLLSFIDKPYLLFDLNVSDARYDNDNRLRLFSDGILFLGSIFSFNKSLTKKNDRLLYSLFFLMSLYAIFLMGFRTIIMAILVVCFLLYVKIRRLSFKFAVLSTILLGLSFFLFINSDAIQKRTQEIVNRNQTANFGNEDYVRVLLFNYYYTNYFKSTTEMVLGSGMVRRVYDNPEVTKTFKGKYPSKYSKEVSLNADRYHFFPVDLGLIGFSWEAGIPTAIILLLICFLLLIPSQDDEYNYIRGWGLFIILTSVTLPFYYCHKNMIFTVVIIIIFMKLKGSYKQIGLSNIKDSDKLKK